MSASSDLSRRSLIVTAAMAAFAVVMTSPVWAGKSDLSGSFDATVQGTVEVQVKNKKTTVKFDLETDLEAGTTIDCVHFTPDMCGAAPGVHTIGTLTVKAKRGKQMHNSASGSFSHSRDLAAGDIVQLLSTSGGCVATYGQATLHDPTAP